MRFPELTDMCEPMSQELKRVVLENAKARAEAEANYWKNYPVRFTREKNSSSRRYSAH